MVQTDHRALVWLHKLKDKNARLASWSLILQQYTFTVSHRAGSTNGNADALSRASLENQQLKHRIRREECCRLMTKHYYRNY